MISLPAAKGGFEILSFILMSHCALCFPAHSALKQARLAGGVAAAVVVS